MGGKKCSSYLASEGFGMREHTGKYIDFSVKININKKVESLNISNSAAIVFHYLNYIKKL
jgi:23S rRNA (guanosine2251-2'-O)-methyltransferase